MMKMKYLIILICCTAVLCACASHKNTRAGRVGEDVVGDTLGLPRNRPGKINLPDEYIGIPTPYGGGGAERTCVNAARDIAEITALIGPDIEFERDPVESQSAASHMDKARNFTSEVRKTAPSATADAARSAVVGLNPARSVVRFVARADKIESKANREHQLFINRRAWLRGAFDAWDCDPSLLDGAN